MASVHNRFLVSIAGFNFLAQPSRGEISAARLKSDFPEQEGPGAAPTFSVGPSDPIWDMVDEAAPLGQ